MRVVGAISNSTSGGDRESWVSPCVCVCVCGDVQSRVSVSVRSSVVCYVLREIHPRNQKKIKKIKKLLEVAAGGSDLGKWMEAAAGGWGNRRGGKRCDGNAPPPLSPSLFPSPAFDRQLSRVGT